MSKSEALPEDTRERLLKVAERLFAEHGFDGTSVKDLAEAADVNVSLVSYHFGGKDGLYRACLEQFGRERLAVAERVLQPPQSVEGVRVRLRMYAEEVLVCHLTQPDLVRILHRECELGMDVAIDVFKNSFMKVFETLIRFVTAAQKSGFLRNDLDPLIASGLFFGSIMHVSRSELISKKLFGISITDQKHRTRVVETAVEMFLSGCLNPTVSTQEKK